MLEVSNLSVAYGGLRALTDVSLTVAEGQFVTVVGPNGAGKSTLFKTICGVVARRRARSRSRVEDLLSLSGRATRASRHRACPGGAAGVQDPDRARKPGDGRLSARPAARTGRRTLDRIHTLFPILAERAQQLAGTLSGGEQQMLAIGRGLACAPKLLMLDEPSMGLAPTVADTIFERISQIHREDGVTILLVEQRVAEALELSDHGYVLETGHMVLEGPYETLLADDRVRRSYLGLTDA